MSKPIEILKPGTFTAMNGQRFTFTDADIAASAAAYDPELSEAPLVIGHPKTNTPAYGWVKSLAADGRLKAEPHRVNAEFADMVNAGSYGKVSAAFFTPDSASNPKPGVYYLRHVGFLGGAAPAVKGLEGPTLAGDDGDVITVNFSLGDESAQLTPVEIDMPKDDTAAFAEREAKVKGDEANIAKSRKQLDADQKAFDDKQAAFADAEGKRYRTEVVAFADGLVEKGMLPKHKDSLVEFMAGLDVSAEIELSDGDGTSKQPAQTWFRSFVNELVEQSGGDAAFASMATKGHVPKTNNPLLADAESRSQAEA